MQEYFDNLKESLVGNRRVILSYVLWVVMIAAVCVICGMIDCNYLLGPKMDERIQRTAPVFTVLGIVISDLLGALMAYRFTHNPESTEVDSMARWVSYAITVVIPVLHAIFLGIGWGIAYACL